MLKTTKKSISLPQSKCPLIKTIDCIIQSLGAVEVEWFLFYAPTIAQDWLLSRADINKVVKLKYYQAHNEFISTANATVIDPDANCLDLSLSGFYPVKVSSLRDFDIQSRDMNRILSHAEIFSFAALKCLQSGNMDSRVFMEPLNPCLWHSWTPGPWPLYRLSAHNR